MIICFERNIDIGKGRYSYSTKMLRIEIAAIYDRTATMKGSS